MSGLLIVNADDFGLTAGVSEGILRAHSDGIVTSTSVLAVGAAFDRSIGSLRDSGLAAGAHLALVGEDPPLLTRSEIPTLTDSEGRLRPSWRSFCPALIGRRIDPEDLRRECGAQLERVMSAGVTVTHLDTHQNLHLLPALASVVLDLAAAHGIDALRVPQSHRRTPRRVGVNRLGRRLRARAERRGLAFPATFRGLDESGHMGPDALRAAVEDIGSSNSASAEIGVHPGSEVDPERVRFRWGFEWDTELHALCRSDIRTEITRQNLCLGSFADLPRVAHR